MRSKTKNYSSSIPAALLLGYILLFYWTAHSATEVAQKTASSSFSKEATNSNSTSFAAAKWTEEQSSAAAAAFEQNSKHQEREIIIFKAFLFYVVLMFLLFTQTSVRHLPSIIYHRKRDRAGIIESIICRAEVFWGSKRGCYKRWENGKMTFPSFFSALHATSHMLSCKGSS